LADRIEPTGRNGQRVDPGELFGGGGTADEFYARQ